jgi:hypothetical protein
MSPSILKSVEIRELVIQLTHPIFNRRKRFARLDFVRSFCADPRDLPGVLKEIVLENGTAGVDRIQDADLLKKLWAFVLANSESDRSSKIRPLVVRLKNLDVSYGDAGLSLSARSHRVV